MSFICKMSQKKITILTENMPIQNCLQNGVLCWYNFRYKEEKDRYLAINQNGGITELS